MARSQITVRVARRGERATELLRETGQRLGKEDLEADEYGVARIALPERGPVAWERVRDALDATGSDWREWLHLQARPRR